MALAANPLRQPADRPTPRGGKDQFATAAVGLAGAAGVMFGWTPEAFWRATPAELAALVTALQGEGGGNGVDAVDGATLKRLKEQFPDG